MSETPEPYYVTETPPQDPRTFVARSWAIGIDSESLPDQGIMSDLNIWFGDQGIDEEKLANSPMDAMLIQIGVGMQTSILLDQQIENCLNADKVFGFFHLPSRYAGPAKDQARHAINVMSERGYENRLLVGDYEPAIDGDYGSMLTSDQAWIYHQEIEYQAGRSQVAYSSPNVLKNYYHEPNWIYQAKWIIARYPKIYYYFEDFLIDYPWKIPTGYLPNVFYEDCCLGVQFSKSLRAQKYMAVATLPTGGPGKQSCDGYAMLMLPSDLILLIGGDPGDPPEPDDLEERVIALEVAVDDLTARVIALENAEPEPPPEKEQDTVWATVVGEEGDKLVAFYAGEFNKAGKPIMRKYQPVIRFEIGEQVEIYPQPVDADGTLDYYRLFMTAADGTVLYCREDRVEF